MRFFLEQKQGVLGDFSGAENRACWAIFSGAENRRVVGVFFWSKKKKKICSGKAVIRALQ